MFRPASCAAPAATETATAPAAAQEADAAAPSLAELQLPDYAEPAAAGMSSLFGPDVAPARPRHPGVHARSAHTREAAAAQLQRLPGGTR